jgi:hypothetical protein
MPNKNRTEAETRVDPSVAKKEYQILQSFDFEGRYQKSGGQQGILCFDFFFSWGIE